MEKGAGFVGDRTLKLTTIKQAVLILAARIGVAALALVTAASWVSPAARAEFKVGAKLPEFSLKTADGATLSLQRKEEGQVVVTQATTQLKPKVLLIHLFQPDCLQCQA